MVMMTYDPIISSLYHRHAKKKFKPLASEDINLLNHFYKNNQAKLQYGTELDESE